jgi:glutaredoxin-like YruB-family protein
MDTQATTNTNGDVQVQIYSTPTCHFCHMAKEWMTENKISYVDYNVAEDMGRRKEMVEITGQLGVPVIMIGENIMVGFNQEEMAKLLNVAE